jgi:hypothetical protein
MTPNTPQNAATQTVKCPWSDFGDHDVELDLPAVDGGVGLCPICAHEYRIHAGPPIALTKHD